MWRGIQSSFSLIGMPRAARTRDRRIKSVPSVLRPAFVFPKTQALQDAERIRQHRVPVILYRTVCDRQRRDLKPSATAARRINFGGTYGVTENSVRCPGSTTLANSLTRAVCRTNRGL